MTPEQAAARLVEIQGEIDKTGTTAVPLRERLDLYYLATGTSAEQFDADEEFEDDE